MWWTSGDGAGVFDPERGSSTPVLTATYPGTANITCTQDGVVGRATLEINGDPPALASIAIIPAAPELGVGDTLSLEAVGYDQYGDEFPLDAPTWTHQGDGDGSFDPPSGNASTLFLPVSGSVTTTSAKDTPLVAVSQTISPI